MPRAQGDTRERMLAVAETRFARKGFEGAHLESIAREVGVRKTALYYYFESKADLYVAVLERMLLEFDRVVSAVLDRDDLTHAQKLVRLVDDLNDLLASRPNYSQILIRIFVDRIPIDGSRISPIIERVVGRTLSFYSEGTERGVFRRLSSRHFFISVLGMASFHYAGGAQSAAVLGVEDVFARDAVDWRRDEVRGLLLRGVLAGDAGRGA